MKNKKAYIALLFVACIAVLALLGGPVSITGWAQDQTGGATPTKYIKFDPAVYDSTSGGTVKILWNFEYDQIASIKIFNNKKEIVRTLVSAKSYPGGFVENSETWDGRDDSGDTVEDGLYKVEVRPLPPSSSGEPDWSVFPSIGTIIVSSRPANGINIAPNLEGEGPNGNEADDTFVVYGPLDEDNIVEVKVNVDGDERSASLNGSTWTLDVKVRVLDLVTITAVKFVEEKRTVTNADGSTSTITVIVEKPVSGRLRLFKYIVDVAERGDTLGSIAEDFYGDYNKLRDIANDNGLSEPYKLEDCWRLLIHNPDNNVPRDLPQYIQSLVEAKLLGEQEAARYTQAGLDPVNFATGNYTHKHADIKVSGKFPIEFVRFYNSTDSYSGRLGMNWHHNFENRLLIHRSGDVDAIFADGHRERYELEGTASFRSPQGIFNQLKKHSDDNYTLTLSDHRVYTYNEAGFLTEITDANGNKTELSYENLKLVEVKTGSGYLKLRYDLGGNIIKVTDQSGRSVEYDYDDRLNLTSFTGPEGEIITYSYNDNFYLTEVRSPRGDGSYVNTYDSKGRVIEQVDPRGGISVLSYDDGQNITRVTDPLGRTTVYRHDENYRLIECIDPLGQSEHFAYDDNNNMTSYTDKKGCVYQYNHDDRGNVLTLVDPVQRTTSFEYNQFNKPTKMVLPDGKQYSYEYDAAGNLVKIVDPLVRVTEICYDSRGLVTSITTADGSATSFAYDEAGNLKQHVDALNNITKFDYDAVNRVKQITEPVGSSTALAYDGNDMATRVTNACSHNKTFTYDSNGKLKTLTDEEGHTTTYYYNGADQTTKAVDPLGNITLYEYDRRGKVNAFTDANGNRTVYQYDELDRLKEVTDAGGYTTRLEYDANNNLVRRTEPRGGTMEYTYDQLNRLLSVKDPMGGVTGYEYDLMGRVVRTTDPLGHATSFGYDDAGRLISTTDPLGNLKKYTYDEMDRVKTFTDVNGAVWQMEYDRAGNRIGMVDPEGRRYGWQYDGNRRVTSATDPLGNTTSYQYNPLGQVEKITDALGHTRTFTYTERGQVASVTDANGNTTSYQYDPLKRLVAVTDAQGQKTNYDYDPVGNLTAVHQYRAILPETLAAIGADAATVTGVIYNQSVTENVYDNNSEPTVNDFVYGQYGITGFDYTAMTVTGAVYLDSSTTHQPTYYRYDKRNLLVAVEDTLGHEARYTYDAGGNLVQVTDKDGHITGLGYDLKNQLTHIQYGDGRQVTLNYNPQGFVTGMTDWLGTTGFELDPLGRIRKATDFAGRVQQYTWTATGKKESIIYPDSSRVTYGYDQLDRLTTVTDAFDRITQYNYNPVGKLVETLLPNGTKTIRDYDGLYRITALIQQDPTGKITDSYQYGYDPAGNKTFLKKSKTDEDEIQENEEKTFAYDALNQLVSVSEINGDTRNYYYDTLGNRVALIEQEQNQKNATYYQYDRLNKLTRTSGHDGEIKDYSYDNRGNLTEIKSGGKVFNTYAFDAANKLTKVINKFGDSTTYTYDGLGNRIQTVIDLNQGSGNHNRPVFPPGPGGPPAFVEELRNKNPGPPSHAGNPKPGWDHQFKRDYMVQHYVVDYTKPYDNLLMSYGEHSQIQRYTYGRELVSLDFIAINDHDNGWIPQGTETAYVDQWDTLYYLHDEMGTVAKVIGSSGKTSAHYNYDEFGRPLGAVKLDPNWPGPDNAVSYTGYTYDHFAELYYAQARYYLPEVGRFISTDPRSGRIMKPQTLNPYPYVLNNPLKYVDPLGLEASWSDCDWKRVEKGYFLTYQKYFGSRFSSYNEAYEYYLSLPTKIIEQEDIFNNVLLDYETIDFYALYKKQQYEREQYVLNELFIAEGEYSPKDKERAVEELREIEIEEMPLPIGGSNYVKGLAGMAKGAGNAVGIVTKNGIKIEGFTGHGVDRAIGDGFKRAGVSPQGILDAMKNPLKINDVVTDSMGRQSQRFIGRSAEVVVNPETGRIISVNPTSSSKAAKLLRELGLME